MHCHRNHNGDIQLPSEGNTVFRNILPTVIAGAAALFSASAPAQAAVTYSFTAAPAPSSGGRNAGSFVYTVPTFISSTATPSRSDLTSCSSVANLCAVGIYPDASNFAFPPRGDFADAIAFEGSIYYFDNGDFGKVGTSTGKYIGEDRATLVISTTAVPEPAAWVMMLVGFGGLGVAMRSRRRTVRA